MSRDDRLVQGKKAEASEADILSRRNAMLLAAGASVVSLAVLDEAQADTVFTSYAFPATGAPTPRTMPDRLAEVFNVKDYGAKGDSTNYLNGTNDLPAIQAAIAAARAAASSVIAYTGSGCIYFPPGIYHVDGSIDFSGGGELAVLGSPTSASAIGGSFPDFVLSDELDSRGPSLGSVRNIRINNRYKNFLTSCSYAASGTATCSDASISGTTLTLNSGISGTFGIGQILTGPGISVASNTVIAAVLSGAGGARSTYQLSRSSKASNIAITASEGGVVTFTAVDAVAANISVGQYFHVFGMYPRAFNGRYVVCKGTSGRTFVGGGNCRITPNNVTGDPGAVTMLGAIGGGGVRINNALSGVIDKCRVGAFNGLHLGGAFGYGNLGGNAYNAFGVSVRDTTISWGINGEYGTVGAFCGQTNFWDCAITQYDLGAVVSSNGFGFHHGHLENNNIGIVLGRDDQLFPATCGASSITTTHTEDCDISVDVVLVSQHYMAANQWTGAHAARGSHTGVTFTGTTASSNTITSIAATVVTGNTTIHSPRITSLSTLVGLYEGMAVTGTGIPAGSAILTFDSASSLTFINTAGSHGDPIGASATGSTVSITATVAVRMRVSGTNIPGNTCVSAVDVVSGGTYQVTLNKTTTGAGTNSFNFNPTPTYGVRFGTVGGATISGTTIAVASSVAGFGIGSSNCGAVTFIGCTAGSNAAQAGLGVGWEVPAYPASPSAAGIKYINCDNPSMAFTYTCLPGQPGQSLNIATEGMEYDITDSKTNTWGATAAAGGSNRVKVRYNGTNWTVVAK